MYYIPLVNCWDQQPYMPSRKREVEDTEVLFGELANIVNKVQSGQKIEHKTITIQEHFAVAVCSLYSLFNGNTSSFFYIIFLNF